MLVHSSDLKTPQRYFLMTQTVQPRPIAWLLSRSASGALNLAPFSYFNAVCSAPPLLMVSVGVKPNGEEKDTLRNIREQEHFVIHIAPTAMVKVLNESAAPLPIEESELDRLKLSLEPMADFPLPRLADCSVAFACRRYRLVPLGEAGQCMVLAEVLQFYIDDRIVTRDAKGRFTVDSQALDPLARLGVTEYAHLGTRVYLRIPAA